ncbi:MAG TPA: SPASM domain-containing protein [Bacteroidia bacterium]|nr:SPASM domain-containing protein [Bacteroidia bacterium]
MNKNLGDLLNLSSHTDFHKITNATRVVRSYLSSKWTGSNRHSGMPIAISIEPTTACNLRCPECPSGLRSFTRPTGMLEPELFQKVIDELSKELIYLIFYFQGEPYLNTAFLDLVEYASKNGIYTATSTNAHYLNDENAERTVASGLDRLIISIDGTTQEVYEQYRVGGKLDKVIEGTRNIIRWKKKLRSKTPHTIFQFLVVGPNEHQTAEVKKLARELGVDEVAFKTAQIYDFENGSELIPKNAIFSRYRRNEKGLYEIKNPLLNHCWKLWHSCVITWDGKVIPCCFDKDAQYVMGDLNAESFREIWTNEKYQAFRQSVLRSRSEIEMCKNCTEGTKVWA